MLKSYVKKLVSRLSGASRNIKYPEDDFPRTDLVKQLQALVNENKMRNNAETSAQERAEKAALLVLERHERHEEDLIVQDLREKWNFGMPMDCWEQTAEEKEFGVTPPNPPERMSRFDLLDVEN